MISANHIDETNREARDTMTGLDRSRHSGVESLGEILSRYMLTRGLRLPVRSIVASRRETDLEPKFASKT